VAVARRQEAVIKLSLGASRARLIREFLRESALICVSSGALGWTVAWFAIRRFSEISINLPALGSYAFGLNLHLDATVAALTSFLILLATFATGLAPALYASSPNLAE